MQFVVASLEPSRGKLVSAKSSRESLTDGEVLVGDEGRGNDTEESTGGDDNGDEEALLTRLLLGVLTVPTVSCWTDSNDDEPCPRTPVLLVCSCAFWSTAVTGGSG